MHLLWRGAQTPRTSSVKAVWVVPYIPQRCLPHLSQAGGSWGCWLSEENVSLTLPFFTTEARDSVGLSAHTDTRLGTVESVMPYLLSQYLRILWDGHHLCTYMTTSQSSLIYWWDLSHSMWKTAPTKIPLLGKRQLKSQYKQSAHLETACTFQMPHSWKQVPHSLAW